MLLLCCWDDLISRLFSVRPRWYLLLPADLFLLEKLLLAILVLLSILHCPLIRIYTSLEYNAGLCSFRMNRRVYTKFTYRQNPSYDKINVFHKSTSWVQVFNQTFQRSYIKALSGDWGCDKLQNTSSGRFHWRKREPGRNHVVKHFVNTGKT